jgi:hypothetical protein
MREMTSAPKAVCWFKAAAPAQTRPLSNVVIDGQPQRHSLALVIVAGPKHLVGVDDDGGQRDGHVTLHPGAAGQTVSSRLLRLRQPFHLLLVEGIKGSLGDQFAFVARSPTSARLLQGQAGGDDRCAQKGILFYGDRPRVGAITDGDFHETLPLSVYGMADSKEQGPMAHLPQT